MADSQWEAAGARYLLLIMDKRLAHFILLVFDALSFLALYHVIDKWDEVSQSITSSVNSIELQSPFGLYIATLVMPIVHSQSLIKIKSKSTEKARNYVISGLLVSLLLAGFVFDYLIEKKVTNAGYKYCSSEGERLHSRSSKFTSKIGLASKVFIVLAGLTSSFLFASTTSSPNLTLSCSVHSDNFGTESGLLTSKNVSIEDSVLTREGRSLVYETDDLEFWALTHMTQELNGDHFINNFEVAIHEKSTNRFYNALSDSVFSSDQAPKSARIRLTNDKPDTFLKESYVMFECKSANTDQQ